MSYSVNLINKLEGFYKNNKVFCIATCIATAGLPLIGYLGLRVVVYACCFSDQENRVNDVFQQSFNKEAECCISTENIPEQFRVDLNGQSYHVGNLILAILTQDQPRDIYTRQKIDSETLGLLANYMGVPSESFQNIWNEVTTSQVELKKADIVQHKWNTQPDANFEDIMKQVYDSNEVATHMRFEKLYHLLTANQMPSDEKALRENFLTFLRRQDVWKKFEKSQQGWMLLV